MLFRSVRFQVILGSMIFLGILSSVSLEADDTIVAQFIAEAKYFSREDQFDLAAEAFARALLLEPSSVEAHYGLLDLAEQKRTSSAVHKQLTLYEAVSAALEKQQYTIDDLVVERQNLVDDLLADGLKRQQIEDRLSFWENKAFLEWQRLEEKIQSTLTGETKPLVSLNTYIAKEKEKKFLKMSYLEQQVDDLKNLQFALRIDDIPASSAEQDSYPTSDFYNAFGELQVQTKTQPILKVKNFTQMKNTFQALRFENRELKDMLYRQGERLEKLSAQVVDLSLSISEQQMIEKNQPDRASLEEMRERLQEWRSRFELSENMMKRKDQELVQLRERVEMQQNELAAQQKEQEEALAQKVSIIESLGKEIFSLNVKVDRLREERLAMTKKEMKKISGDQIAYFKEEVASRDKKVRELEGVLELYKGLLADTVRGSQSKDLLVEEHQSVSRQLRTDVQRLEGEIDRKDVYLKDYRDDLKNLSVKVQSMQDKLLALEKEQDEQQFVTPVYKKRMTEMRIQLNDLNHFIQKELQESHWSNLN